ncbi:MAG TPA: hypothetical protein VKV15_06825 [Bryobacteraceae bacterium]|nr:hypothetical protein [Bryobacteraceae bacterium]
MNRRKFVTTASAMAAQLDTGLAETRTIVVDPAPMFKVSPYLYMQYLQNIGISDGSTDCYWDYARDDFREDFVKITHDLSPGMLRYSGTNIRYYKRREGVGPFKQRPLVRNYEWGGMDDNRVGTHEFVELCRRTGSEPIVGVNFLSDGVRKYWKENRTGDAREAADWVSYTNDPDNAERKRNGSPDPLTVKFWELGNETSYGREVFGLEECIAHTIEFAKAMRERSLNRVSGLGGPGCYRQVLG